MDLSKKRLAPLLIVDDEPEIREILIQIADQLGIRSIGAASGEEALRVLASQEVAAIIADVQMPNGDGRSILQEIRQNNPSIPFAFLSAFELSPQEESLTKPFEIEEVERLMKKLISKSLEQSPD